MLANVSAPLFNVPIPLSNVFTPSSNWLYFELRVSVPSATFFAPSTKSAPPSCSFCNESFNSLKSISSSISSNVEVISLVTANIIVGILKLVVLPVITISSFKFK